MKLSIAKNELQRGLTRIQSIVEKRNTMPILANVLLEASKTGSGALSLAATDLEVGIRSSHPAEVKKAGSVTAAAKKLYEIVRELPPRLQELLGYGVYPPFVGNVDGRHPRKYLDDARTVKNGVLDLDGAS